MCPRCIGASADQCTECVSASTLDANDSGYGTCICDDGYYQDVTSCLVCKNLCDTCSSRSVCNTCKDNARFSDTTQGECVCSEGFERVVDSTGVMTCELINIFTECTTGQYLDDNNQCQNCDASCNGCVGGGIDYCLGCAWDNTYKLPLGMLSSLEFGVCFCQDGYKQKGNACVEYSCETDCDACPDSSLCALCSAGKDITTSDLTLCYCPDGTTRTNEGVKICYSSYPRLKKIKQKLKIKQLSRVFRTSKLSQILKNGFRRLRMRKSRDCLSLKMLKSRGQRRKLRRPRRFTMWKSRGQLRRLRKLRRPKRPVIENYIGCGVYLKQKHEYRILIKNLISHLCAFIVHESEDCNLMRKIFHNIHTHMLFRQCEPTCAFLVYYCQ